MALATGSLSLLLPMTQATQRAFLVAEKATLESLLSTLPEDSILERIGFASRLGDVTAELAMLHDAPAGIADAELHAAMDPVTIDRREDADHALPGVFLGVLHASRRFEHRLTSGDVIRGIAEPGLDLSTLVAWYLQRCIAHVRVLRWTRTGREHRRYMLRRLDHLPSPG